MFRFNNPVEAAKMKKELKKVFFPSFIRVLSESYSPI